MAMAYQQNSMLSNILFSLLKLYLEIGVKEGFVLNKSWMDEDDDQEDVSKDAADGDDTIDATIDNDINLFVNTRICGVLVW